jgi:hypothetical protein
MIPASNEKYAAKAIVLKRMGGSSRRHPVRFLSKAIFAV